jgi:hypothetical protein
MILDVASFSRNSNGYLSRFLAGTQLMLLPVGQGKVLLSVNFLERPSM